MQKAKGTAAARKHASEDLKAFFRDPENRRKRSIAMKGQFMYSIVNVDGFVKLTSSVFAFFPPTS